MNTSFYNKNGQLSSYGFNCSYVERFELNNQYVEMYKEHTVYHVRYGVSNTKYTEWLTYDLLSQARKSYNNKVSQLKKANKLIN